MIIPPKVLIVDNEPGEVRPLEIALGHMGFHCKVVTCEIDLLRALNVEFFQFILLDVALGKDGTDTEGLKLGKICAKKVPGSIRICTSGIDTIKRVRGPEIIAALNPNLEDDLRRIFYAFGSKSDEDKDNKRVDHYVERRRAKVIGSCDRADFKIDPSDGLSTDIDQGFKGIMWKGPDDVGEFYEIIKRLAHRPPLPSPITISLTKMGKGRSNTLVCLATLDFPSSRDAPGRLRPLRNIIKIGRSDAVRKEAENYGKFVWQLFRPELYPKMELFVENNNLGGIAYSLVEDRSTNAKTLGDLAFDAEHPINEVLDLCELALNSRLVGEITASSRTLLPTLTDRFHRIKDPAVRNAAIEIVRSEWSRIGAADGSQGKRTISDGQSQFTVSLEADFDQTVFLKYEPCYTGLQHGDFHSDNILCIRPNAQWHTFVIDFANTGICPISLDHVVLEVALRYQFLRFLNDRGLGNSLDGSGTYWAQFELALLSVALEGRPQFPVPPIESLIVRNLLERVFAMIVHTRCNYRETYLKSTANKDTATDSKQSGAPSPPDLLSQYLVASSLSALSAIALPMGSTVATTHREWMSTVSGISLAGYNKLRAVLRENAKMPLKKAWETCWVASPKS